MALPRIDAPEYELEIYNGDIIKFRPIVRIVREQLVQVRQQFYLYQKNILLLKEI